LPTFRHDRLRQMVGKLSIPQMWRLVAMVPPSTFVIVALAEERPTGFI
jgi:hypothetical protein